MVIADWYERKKCIRCRREPRLQRWDVCERCDRAAGGALPETRWHHGPKDKVIVRDAT